MNFNNIEFTRFVMDLKKKFKGDIFDNFGGKSLGSTEIRYIASLRNEMLLKELKDYIRDHEGLTMKVLNTLYCNLLYIESVHGFNVLIITVKKEYKAMEPSIINYGFDVELSNTLQKAASDLNIKSLESYGFDTISCIIAAVDLCIAESHGLSQDEFTYIKVCNTQKEIVKFYNHFRLNPPAACSVNPYYHVQIFGFIYYAVINVISDVLGKSRIQEPVTVHDAGASSSQFTMMLSTLSEEELMGLNIKHIIASDLEFTTNDATLKYLKECGGKRPVDFIEQDFTDESLEFPQTDITVILDVLEHFNNEETAFAILERLWKCTRKLLVVHVPMEDEPNTAWGHYISFNREKLIEWASRLKSHRSLGDEYRFEDGTAYTDQGFIIISKIDG
jgi:hypothetical protein